jgi:4-hydroxy-2-oxoheptanedioate aldolase
MFPQISRVDEAKDAIASMYYPPLGTRGMAQMIRPTQYQKNFEQYYQTIHDELLGIIQIEKKEILDDLDEVANIEGVDILFIGPSDLTLSLGIFGQFEHPVYLDVLKATVEAAKNAGKATGVLFMDPAFYDMYYELGFRFIGCGSDMVFLRKGAENTVAQLQKKRENYKPGPDGNN